MIHEICTESSDVPDFTQINEDLDIIERIVDSVDGGSCVQMLEKQEKIPAKQDKLPNKLPENTQIIITPINKNYKSKSKRNLGEPCSKTDWDEQCERQKAHQQMMWDDTPQTNRKKETYFACFNNSKANFILLKM